MHFTHQNTPIGSETSTPIYIPTDQTSAQETLAVRNQEIWNLSQSSEDLMDLTSRVALVLDGSESMRALYENGTIQALIERLLPLACLFDDNQELEVWFAHEGVTRLPNITASNFFDYVSREIPLSTSSTSIRYTPVMKEVFSYYTQVAQQKEPAYVLFVTDGIPLDKEEALKTLRMASSASIFWQFIGMSDETIHYLKRLDELTGRFVDNANVLSFSSISSVTDGELYQKLLIEYPAWLEKATAKGFVKQS